MAIKRCARIKADGARCKGVPIRGSEWCASHHPDTQQARRQGAKRGGRKGGRGRTGPADLREVQSQVRKVIAGVLSGNIPTNVGSVGFMGFNVLLRAIDGELRVREHQELEQRLAELESLLGQKEGRYGYGA